MAAFLIPERCTWARGAWACASLLASVVTVMQAILRRQLEEGTKHRRYYFTSAGLTMYLSLVTHFHIFRLFYIEIRADKHTFTSIT